jgi:hypothetical protein
MTQAISSQDGHFAADELTADPHYLRRLIGVAKQTTLANDDAKGYHPSDGRSRFASLCCCALDMMVRQAFLES